MTIKYTTSTELIELFGWSSPSFYDRVKKGYITEGRKVGRRRMYYLPDVFAECERNGLPVSEAAQGICQELIESGLMGDTNLGSNNSIGENMTTHMMNRPFTTGEAAKICRVSLNTIMRSFDAGEFKNGFLIPRSNHRRIPRDDLKCYMMKYGIAMDRFPEMPMTDPPKMATVSNSRDTEPSKTIQSKEHVVKSMTRSQYLGFLSELQDHCADMKLELTRIGSSHAVVITNCLPIILKNTIGLVEDGKIPTHAVVVERGGLQIAFGEC